MGKLAIKAIAGVVIIYKYSDPSWIFMERKPDNYPHRVFRRKLCPFGGRWGGNEAKNDENPKSTLIRELEEEFEINRLALPHPGDILRFAEVKRAILNKLTPFGDFLLVIPPSVFKTADPDSKREIWVSIASYWTVGLSDEEWETLTKLQRMYGNLCNEGTSTITSLDRVLEFGKPLFSWGSDRVMKEFWVNKGMGAALYVPFLPGIGVYRLRSEPLGSYREYLDYYDVFHKPPGV
ncbi:MAG: hypothetical protein HYW90_04980 [Candidatus Sungbacteria bacterium]|nr:hypothetical protein [Candidatus Sungbacteria bacterium]